jgi:hypothetical protein
VKRYRWALAGAAVATALSLGALTMQPARATDSPPKTWVSQGAHKCLGVLNRDMTNSTAIVQWACDGTPNQQWIISTSNANGMPDGQPTTIRNNQDHSKCLGVLASATNDGAKLVIWDCISHLDQQWVFENVSAPSAANPLGCWSIENQNALAKVVGILAASPIDGAQAVIWDNLANTNPDQVFC